MSRADQNQTVLVIAYGSLLSGFGMLARRRGGDGRLVAREAFLVAIGNARRGLAKPSSHGRYLAMDLEPIDRARPITARAGGCGDDGGIGGLGLVFDRACLPTIARREEYDPGRLEQIAAMADRAGLAMGDFLLAIAERAHFDLLEYRRALRATLGYTSPGYIFHPIPLQDGRVAIAAIGSGYEGSGDPAVISRRREFGMGRLLGFDEAMTLANPAIDRPGEIAYFAECLLGGVHGVEVGDLAAGVAVGGEWAREVARLVGARAVRERTDFLEATGLDDAEYRKRFGSPRCPALERLLRECGQAAAGIR